MDMTLIKVFKQIELHSTIKENSWIYIQTLIHDFAHFPHLIHFDSSILGALNGESCIIASVGQIFKTGQG